MLAVTCAAGTPLKLSFPGAFPAWSLRRLSEFADPVIFLMLLILHEKKSKSYYKIIKFKTKL